MQNEQLDPDAAQMFAKVRRLMVVSGALTLLAIAAVLGVVGYRIMRIPANAARSDVTVILPKGARIVSTATADDRIVVTVEAGGETELHVFDVQTLQPRGRLRLRPER